ETRRNGDAAGSRGPASQRSSSPFLFPSNFAFSGPERFQASSDQGIAADAFLLRQRKTLVEQPFFQMYGNRFAIRSVFRAARFGFGPFPARFHGGREFFGLVGH